MAGMAIVLMLFLHRVATATAATNGNTASPLNETNQYSEAYTGIATGQCDLEATMIDDY